MGVAVGEPPTGAAAAEGGGGGGERKGRFAWWCRNWRRRGSSYYQSDAEANVEHFFIAFDSHGRVSFFERIMVELGDGGYIKKMRWWFGGVKRWSLIDTRERKLRRKFSTQPLAEDFG
jgi:hypothetical protein